MAVAVGGTAVAVREYREADERAWLRCRALAFLGTAYFDDVLPKKPQYDAPAVELVAESGGSLVALMDVAVHPGLATIETVAVHPDCVRAGIATELLRVVLARLGPQVQAIDAWTREDDAANRWYLAHGFDEAFRYLHVYANGDEETAAAIDGTHLGLAPVRAFFHADISEEGVLRRHFARVHICRRYLRPLATTPVPDAPA